MAPQKRIREQPGDLSPETVLRGPPAKRSKSGTQPDFDAWEYPPEFWDRLSKIEPTHKALRELNHRTRIPRPNRLAKHAAITPTTHRDIARFARQGGPDLADLRGYPPSPISCPVPAIMSSRKSSRSGGSRSANPASTAATSVTTKSKKSTPYNRDFEQHLTDHGIHSLYSSEEPDLDEIMSALAKPRPSLSPSQFCDGVFKAFQKSNIQAKDEDDVLAHVISTILGPNQTSFPSARNTILGNLEQLTDGTIAPAKPDIYYGAYPEELSRPVRDALGAHIIPSSMHDKPMAPNFFLEVKGPDGSAAVATRQARYDGAVGARAMHSLQNYGREELEYDGQAYTFTSTYHNGQLQMYAHHPTAPTTDRGQPGYHMTQVDAWAMTGNRDGFVRGATAFRNARDLAKQKRDSFIQEANATASREVCRAPVGDLTPTGQLGNEEESSDDFVDCASSPLPETPDGLSPVAPDSEHYSQPSVPPELVDTATGFTSSFTANSTKRSRPPPSPESKFVSRSPPSKSRHPPGATRRSHNPPVVGPSPIDEAESL